MSDVRGRDLIVLLAERRHGRWRLARSSLRCRWSGFEDTYTLAAFRRGLFQEGYVAFSKRVMSGRNARIEYHYADGQYDRLPALARELASYGADLSDAYRQLGEPFLARTGRLHVRQPPGPLCAAGAYSGCSVTQYA